jgi:bisphosphoglycerate-dependent phosphoglycerate mutase
MIKEKIKVNNRTYNVSMNEQTQMYAARLRRLYQQSYSDMDSFDEVSSEISRTVTNLLNHAISPEVKEDDMDGVVQQLLKMYEK